MYGLPTGGIRRGKTARSHRGNRSKYSPTNETWKPVNKRAKHVS